MSMVERVTRALHAEPCRVMGTEEPAWDTLSEDAGL